MAVNTAAKLETMLVRIKETIPSLTQAEAAVLSDRLRDLASDSKNQEIKMWVRNMNGRAHD